MARRGGYRGGPYRMTAARRTALKKAQQASAKKRRRNRRIATAAVGGAAVVAAYAGYKYGPKAGSIASDLKARTPRNVAGAQSKVRRAVQQGATQVTRMKNGLTRGKVNGAGPEGASKAPRPMKRTTVPMPTDSQVDQIRKQAERAERARRPESRQARQGYNEDGTVKSRIIGIPRGLAGGRKVRRKAMKSAMIVNNEHIMSMGVMGKNTQQINSALDSMVRSGEIRKDYNPRRRRRGKARRKAATQKKKMTFSESVMSQWDKDFGGM